MYEMMELLRAFLEDPLQQMYSWWNLKTHRFLDCINMSRNGHAMWMTPLLMLKMNLLIMSYQHSTRFCLIQASAMKKKIRASYSFSMSCSLEMEHIYILQFTKEIPIMTYISAGMYWHL